jgi:hypothetical protein
VLLTHKNRSFFHFMPQAMRILTIIGAHLEPIVLTGSIDGRTPDLGVHILKIQITKMMFRTIYFLEQQHRRAKILTGRYHVLS